MCKCQTPEYNYRSVEDDISYWIDADAEDGEPVNDPLLRHLCDAAIYGLGDSYDDGRIDTLIYAYTELRGQMLGLMK